MRFRIQNLELTEIQAFELVEILTFEMVGFYEIWCSIIYFVMIGPEEMTHKILSFAIFHARAFKNSRLPKAEINLVTPNHTFRSCT